MSYVDDYTGVPHEGHIPGTSLLDYYDQVEFAGYNAGLRDGQLAASQYSTLAQAQMAYTEDFEMLDDTVRDDYEIGFIIGYGEVMNG